MAFIHLRNGTSLRYHCITGITGRPKHFPIVHLKNEKWCQVICPRLILQEAVCRFEKKHLLTKLPAKALPLLHFSTGSSVRYQNIMALVTGKDPSIIKMVCQDGKALEFEGYDASVIQGELMAFETTYLQLTSEYYDSEQQ